MECGGDHTYGCRYDFFYSLSGVNLLVSATAMSLLAASVQQGLTTYAANKWVENFDSVMHRLFEFDPDNLLHTMLYALILTVLIVIFSRLIDDFIRPDDDNYYRRKP